MSHVHYIIPNVSVRCVTDSECSQRGVSVSAMTMFNVYVLKFRRVHVTISASVFHIYSTVVRVSWCSSYLTL
jgi:hypothetical protein